VTVYFITAYSLGRIDGLQSAFLALTIRVENDD